MNWTHSWDRKRHLFIVFAERATIANEPYALRALALYNSFLPFMGDKRFAVYCIDDDSVRLLENLQDSSLIIIPPNAFEDGELLALKKERATNEYCWTCKPVVLEHAMQHYPEIEWAVYLDSDMMAFGDPDQALPTDPGASAVLTPHRPSDDHFAQFIPSAGFYNAGYAGFKNSEAGRIALRWWRDRCIECCPNIPINGTYADQKYLDDLALNFAGVWNSPSAGLNAGPWNILGGQISVRGDRVFVNDDPLFLYHMQAFHIYSPRLFDNYRGHIRIPEPVRRFVYQPYENLISKSWKTLTDANPGFMQTADSSFWRFIPLLRELKKALSGISNLSARF